MVQRSRLEVVSTLNSLVTRTFEYRSTILLKTTWRNKIWDLRAALTRNQSEKSGSHSNRKHPERQDKLIRERVEPHATKFDVVAISGRWFTIEMWDVNIKEWKIQIGSV